MKENTEAAGAPEGQTPTKPEWLNNPDLEWHDPGMKPEKDLYNPNSGLVWVEFNGD